jgi:Ca2+-binding EF-hand superfamily protein
MSIKTASLTPERSSGQACSKHSWHRGIGANQPSAEDLMVEMDTNRDGGIDDNEYLNFVWREQAENEAKKMFREFDKNGDRKMTLPRVSEHWKR